MRDGCPFCDYAGPSEVLATYAMGSGEVFVIEPTDPVTPGHVLVIPRAHVWDFAHHPRVTGDVVHAAAIFCDDPNVPYRADYANLITSMGEAATQTVKHLHVHLVPRRDGDGLLLPWSVAAPHSTPWCTCGAGEFQPPEMHRPPCPGAHGAVS